MGGLSKNKLKQSLKKIFRLSSWKIALILILLGFLTATLMRFDHIKMTELRDAVMTADSENNDEKIATALEELRAFTLKHIIFNTVEENGVQKINISVRRMRRLRPLKPSLNVTPQIQTEIFIRQSPISAMRVVALTVGVLMRVIFSVTKMSSRNTLRLARWTYMGRLPFRLRNYSAMSIPRLSGTHARPASVSLSV